MLKNKVIGKYGDGTPIISDSYYDDSFDRNKEENVVSRNKYFERNIAKKESYESLSNKLSRLLMEEF